MDTAMVHKELDLIQGVINRMAANSFEVKKWLIGIITAIVVLSKDNLMNGGSQVIWILLLPILSFWYLDAFYLSKEKLFKEMYRWVVNYRNKTEDYLYDLNTMKRICNGTTENLIKKKNGILRTAISPSLLPFYLIPVACILMLILFQSS